jgi:DNA-binding GntR family transcriptional regulator
VVDYYAGEACRLLTVEFVTIPAAHAARSESPVSEPFKDSIPPIRRQSLGEQVAETLRNLISTDRLKPGDRLVETELATKLNVSRGPIREAIKQLAVEGLVTSAEKGGAYVAEPSLDETRALVGLRYRMETYAIELGIRRITPDGIAELRGMIAEMRAAAAAGEADRLPDLDFRYHRTLWDWAGSKRLTELLSLVVSPLMLSKLWKTWHGDVIAAHEETLDAIESGDIAAIRARFDQVTQTSIDDLIESIPTND